MQCEREMYIRNGYIIQEKKQQIPRTQIEQVLTPHLQEQSTDAKLTNDAVILTRHVIVCPFCGKETPAYTQKENSTFRIRTPQELLTWASTQISWFEEKEPVLHFNTPISATKALRCAHCKTEIRPNQDTVRAILSVRRKTVRLAVQLNMKELLSISWLSKELSLQSPKVYEVLTFNFKNGHSFMSLENANGDRYAIRDVSNRDLEADPMDPLYRFFQASKVVHRELQRQFAAMWPTPLPFQNQQFTLNACVLMTRFIGYDAAFFNALPYTNSDTAYLAKSLNGRMRRMHHIRLIPSLVKASAFPLTKCIRKALYTMPALLIYQKELDTVWQLINNIDHFQKFLQSPHRFSTLLFLYKHPCISSFYEDLKAIRGTSYLNRLLIKHTGNINQYGIEYLSLSARERKEERKKWKRLNMSADTTFSPIDPDLGEWISVPVLQPDIQSLAVVPPDSITEGYAFVRLKNTREYTQAGKKLHNCLRSYMPPLVYVIKKGECYIGAVEVSGRKVVQARLKYNQKLSCNIPAEGAFLTWAKNNDLLYE